MLESNFSSIFTIMIFFPIPKLTCLGDPFLMVRTPFTFQGLHLPSMRQKRWRTIVVSGATLHEGSTFLRVTQDTTAQEVIQQVCYSPSVCQFSCLVCLSVWLSSSFRRHLTRGVNLPASYTRYNSTGGYTAGTSLSVCLSVYVHLAV